ncbi:MAG: hypothetical protein NDJ94_08750 [Vicinamibacteria bacterium]|jgi:hypothetical protein|nr:hypothetical protein [Vicinamibacteria bacterium]
MKKPRGKPKSTNPTPAEAGLSALDQDRSASVADEGGVSAAHVEDPDKVEDPDRIGDPDQNPDKIGDPDQNPDRIGDPEKVAPADAPRLTRAKAGAPNPA